MKNTKFARILRRLLGDEAGATMMEYVILAVMIAAAVTAAAIYFGNTAKNQMNVAGDAMVGNEASAATRREQAQEQQEKSSKAATEQAARFSNAADKVETFDAAGE